MSRAVYIGGFSSGDSYAHEVQEALGEYYEDVDPFSFPKAIASPEEIRKATDRATVFVHSAGMLALQGSVSPTEVHAFGGPIPTPRYKLIARTLGKSAQMYARARSLEDLNRATKFHMRSGAELFIPSRALGHWGPFLSGVISNFDAIQTAEGLAHQAGSRVELNYGSDDKYFPVTDMDKARASNIPGVMLSILPDQTHDDFIMRPKQIIYDYMESKG